jgi:hypothetical protein
LHAFRDQFNVHTTSTNTDWNARGRSKMNANSWAFCFLREIHGFVWRRGRATVAGFSKKKKKYGQNGRLIHLSATIVSLVAVFTSPVA